MASGRQPPAARGFWILLVGLILLAVASCQPGRQGPLLPTHTVQTTLPDPSRTSLFASVSVPTGTEQPVATASPFLRTPQPTSTITPTLQDKKPLDSTGGQSLLVLDPIQIFTPGEASQVIAPILVETNLSPPPTARLMRVELYSLEGKLLVRKIIDWQDIQEQGGIFQDQLDFEVAADSLEAWLILRVEEDPESPVAVNSVHLTLLSEGEPIIHRQGWQAKWIDIQSPGILAEIEGGVVQVSGLTRLGADKPLKIQLVDAQGRVVGQRLAGITEAGEFSPFSAEVSYKISERSLAKVLVFRDDGPNGVITHLASQPIVLKP